MLWKIINPLENLGKRKLWVNILNIDAGEDSAGVYFKGDQIIDYERFKDFLHQGFGAGPVPIYTPSVYVDMFGKVGMNNGRHRYAVLRDMGMKYMPVLMSNQSIKRAREIGIIKESYGKRQ